VILIIWFSRNTWDYFEKENEFNLWLDQIEIGIKTLNPIAIIKVNTFYEISRDKNTPPFL
jgi:hypothetical protein